MAFTKDNRVLMGKYEKLNANDIEEMWGYEDTAIRYYHTEVRGSAARAQRRGG